MEKEGINRAVKISVLLASILLVFSSFKSPISSLSLTIPPAAEAASPTTNAGTCRDDPCPGQKAPLPPVTCKPGPGEMVWPKTGKCVPQNCQKSGFTMVRNAAGNCVPSTAPCEDIGAKRDAKGNCVPKIETEKKSKQERTGGNNTDSASTAGDSGAGIQGGSGTGSGATQQGGLTGDSSTSGGGSNTGTQEGSDSSTQQGGSSGGLILDSGKSAQGLKILVPTERIPSPDDLGTTEAETSTGGSQQQPPIPGGSISTPKGANLPSLGSSGIEDSSSGDNGGNGGGGVGSSNGTAIGGGSASGQAATEEGTSSGSDSNSQAGLDSIDKEGAATQMLENTNITNLESAKQQYLSAWNLTEFRSGFDTFIEPGSAKGYGIYKEINSQTFFMPRKTIELYIEPVGFGYKPIIDKEGDILYQINFTVNALVFDKQGNQTAGVSYDIPIITSHNKNTEQYLTIPLNQEDTPLLGGEYVIRYFITDGSSEETFELAKNIKISQIVVSAS